MSNTTFMILGYIGPETMLPLASVLAAGMGIILMFWKYIVQLIRRMFGVIFGRKKKTADTKTVVADQSEGEKTEG